MAGVLELSDLDLQCTIRQKRSTGRERRERGSHRTRNGGPGTNKGGAVLDERRRYSKLAVVLG